MDSMKLDYLPIWIQEDFKKTVFNLDALQENVFNLEIAVNALKEHKSNHTAPRSLTVNLTIMVNQQQQFEMNETLNKAKADFQQTVLAGLIKARENELECRKLDTTREKEAFLTHMETTLTKMINNNIITLDGMEQTSIKNLIQNEFERIIEERRQDIRTRSFLGLKKKRESQEKKRVQREEENLNRVLENPETREIISRLDNVEKKLMSNNKTNEQKNTRNKTTNQMRRGRKTNNKNNARRNRTTFGQRSNRSGRSPSSNRGRIKNNNNKNNNDRNESSSNSTTGTRHPKGRGRGGGRENQKRQQNSTASTTQSGSRKRNYQRKQN